MKLLTNPLVLRMAVVFIFAAAAFIFGVLIMRALRRELTQGVPDDKPPRSESPGFALATYHAVIQRLKEQEQELQKLRQQAYQRATTSEQVSGAVLSNLTSGVVLFSAAGLVQQANPAAREILGYASVTALHARDLFRGVRAVRMPAGEMGDSLSDAVNRCLRDGRVFRRIEADYTTPAGQQRVLGVTISPVPNTAGDSVGAACLISDLTEITALARQVRVRESLAALGEMSAGIAHEFKNSLATISGYGQMLNTEADPEVVRQFAARITSETTALARIVTDFLNFARPQALVSEPVDIPALLQDCALDCHVQVDVKLPAEFSDCVAGDPTALRQAFSNLLRNSAEAGHNGAVRIEISGEVGPQQARLVLRDNAGGIAKDMLPKIFIPFFTTKPAGTGLGLALVHRIVTEHGGSIAVANEGDGATFTLSFPVRKLAKNGADPS